MCHCPSSYEVVVLVKKVEVVGIWVVTGTETLLDVGLGGSDSVMVMVELGGGEMLVAGVPLVVDGSPVDEAPVDEAPVDGAPVDEMGPVEGGREVGAEGGVEDGMVVNELWLLLVDEETSSVTVWVSTTVTGDAVVCGWMGTTEISVSVTVFVASLSLGEGVAVTVKSCVVVCITETVVACGVAVVPPSMGTTEYVARGRTAWNLGTPCRRSSSATGRHVDGTGKAESRARSGAGRI